MITISKKIALSAIKSGKLPKNLVDQKITIVMRKRDAKRWLAALRDGKQKQTEGKLYSPREKAFCCLGLEQSCNWGGQVQTDGADFMGLPTLSYLRLTGKGYFNAVGEMDLTPSIKNRQDFWSTASGANDNGHCFVELADLLEKHMAVYA